jgi:hypothetical protein
MRRRGNRRKQLPGDRKQRRECWRLKDEALDLTLRSARFERNHVLLKDKLRDYNLDAHICLPHLVGAFDSDVVHPWVAGRYRLQIRGLLRK